jgi:hypothetical protein
MSTTAAPPPSTPPPWAHCGNGADPDRDPVGCRGVQVTGSARCLAHLDDEQRDAAARKETMGEPTTW